MIKEISVALGSAALAVVGLWSTSHLDYFGPIGPGAGMMPITLCVILLGLSLVNLAIAARAPAASLVENTGINWRVVSLFLYYAAYVGAIYYLGFIVSTFLFIFFICFFVEKKHYAFSLACAVLAPAILYLVFSVGLNVSLPAGFIL